MAHADDRLFEPKPAGARTLDRRGAHRFAAIGALRAVTKRDARSGATGGDDAFVLSLIDESDTGAGANVDAPLPPGARLVVLTNALDGVWRSARVVRCMPTKRGYRIGIAYDAVMRKAA